MAKRRGFGSIRKLPSGRHQAHYRTLTGTKITAPATFPSKIEAEIWLSDRRREIDADRFDPAAGRRRQKITFADYAPEWLDTRQVGGRPLKAQTRGHYQGILDRELLPVFGAKLLTGITAADVRSWYATALADKPTMRAHAYSLLRTILTTALADELIDTQPCRIRGAGRVKAPVHQVTPATIGEIDVITMKMPPRLRLTIICASWLAMRQGEILELRRGDIDIDNGIVRIRRGLVRVGGQRHTDTPKSAASFRDVHIPPHLVDRFRDHLFEHTAPGANALLFPSPVDPTRWQQTKELLQHFYMARAAAGRDDLRFHDLRHTGAVLAASTGATLVELMARLGHSTAAAAMRYQHAAADRDKAVADAMSRLAQS
ncbi:tyrosine-type recombinase/integrase [Mycobacterium sp.]|uniref:tyrosine-type recombinase/integrase n=1 Tax=Mycobacterium sp. TaxID=1785 RepID=UPI003BAF1796